MIETWCAIVNVFAASKTTASRWHDAEAVLKSRGVRFETQYTGDGGNAVELTMRACEGGFRHFIAVGGDGTIHDVLQGMMQYLEMNAQARMSDFLLGVIPLGSGNDWIKTAGIPSEINAAAEVFADGETAFQDVVKVTLLDPDVLPEERAVQTAYMANVGGVGLDARVCVLVNQAKSQGKRGKLLYVSALVRCLINRTSSCAAVFCDGQKVFQGKFLSMSLGIGKYSGGGMRQTPDAVMDDGFVDLTIIPDLPFMKIAKEAPKLFNGKLKTVPELVTSRARNISVIPSSGTGNPDVSARECVEVDGEVIGLSPVSFEVLEEQLRILVPRSR